MTRTTRCGERSTLLSRSRANAGLDLLGAIANLLAFGRQAGRRASARPGEHRFPLERIDAARHGRMVDLELLGGTRQAAGVGQREKRISGCPSPCPLANKRAITAREVRSGGRDAVIHSRSRKPTRNDELIPTTSIQAGAGRARLALGALLRVVPGLRWLPQSRPQRLSVEARRKAAGVAVGTGTAIVSGVAIRYRDIGPRSGACDPAAWVPRGRRRVCAGGGRTGQTLPAHVCRTCAVPGLSQRTASGYDKQTLATDVKGLMDQLGMARAHVVGHDLGARVAYAFAVQYPERLLSLTVAEAFIEGLAGYG